MLLLPEQFKNQVETLYPDCAGEFLNAITQNPSISVRLNAVKSATIFADAEPVEWCSQGRYLQQRPSFIADPHFHAGAYYVQEASSMFLAQIVRHIKQQITTPIKVLDLCAAPGGKSTLLLAELGDDDLLVANEVIQSRVGILADNITRWGYHNVVVTNNEAKHFAQHKHLFDVIVLDAPCSGEGMFRKDNDAIGHWSIDAVQHCAMRQQKIIAEAIAALKPGGYILYSTCTFNSLENEQNVQWMMEQFNLQTVEVNSKISEQITSVTQWNNKHLFAYKFLPHNVKGEGFFVACLKKNGLLENNNFSGKSAQQLKINTAQKQILTPWLKHEDDNGFYTKNNCYYVLPQYWHQHMLHMEATLRVRLLGLKLGEIIKQQLIPDHQLALSNMLNPNVPRINLNLTDALKFLRKDVFELPSSEQGIYLITYNNLGLGWAKVLPNRHNNYLPNNWRILKPLKELEALQHF